MTSHQHGLDLADENLDVSSVQDGETKSLANPNQKQLNESMERRYNKRTRAALDG